MKLGDNVKINITNGEWCEDLKQVFNGKSGKIVERKERILSADRIWLVEITDALPEKRECGWPLENTWWFHHSEIELV